MLSSHAPIINRAARPVKHFAAKYFAMQSNSVLPLEGFGLAIMVRVGVIAERGTKKRCVPDMP